MVLCESLDSPIILPGTSLANSFLVANQPTVGPPNDNGDPIDWPSATTISNNSISVSGLAGTTGVGSIVPDAEANVSVSGQEGNGSVGTPTFICKANQTPTGQGATSALGTATTKTDNRFETQNFNAVGIIGSVSFNAKANVTITGVSATGELGTPFKWQEVDDDQTPNWTEVAA